MHAAQLLKENARAARAADRAAQGGPGRDERAAARDGAPAARRRGDEAARRGCGRLLPLRRRALGAPLRSRLRRSTRSSSSSSSRPEREVEGRFDEPLPHPAYEGFASAISAPMTWSGERRGLLGVASRDPDREFGELESNLLETFAGLASLAVRNAASFEQSVRQARVQRGFYGIASALAEHLSHAATLDAVAHAANEALGGSFAAVLMPGARRLELAASYRLPDELASSLADGVPRSAAALETAARERRLLSASSLDDDERFGEDWRRLAGVRSLLAIPVDPPRREEGGLVVVFFAEQRTFTRRRPRAWSPAGRRRARRARAERALRERTNVAGALPAARPHGQPPCHGARPRGDPRRGRGPGAGAARGRRLHDPDRRGRRARRERPRRRECPVSARHEAADDGSSRRRRRRRRGRPW